VKKVWSILLVVVFAVSMIALGTGCAAPSAETTAAETTAAETTAAVEETTVAEETEPAEIKECRLWFWGEDEAPGLTDFLQWVGDQYTERIDPNVTWEISHVDIDQLYTGFYAAVEANDAPELHLLWAGVLGLEPAWADLLVPISDYVSPEMLSKIRPINLQEGYWNGKQWMVPLYLNPWPLGINKQVFRDSGLDPDNLPTTWDGFLDAIDKINAAGFTPWCVGIKDGFYGGWFPSILQYQFYDTPSDYHKAIIGDESLADPPHSNRWYLLQELMDNNAFNPDANSLSLAEGQDIFLNGDVAMLHASGNAYFQFLVEALGEDNIGVWIPPVDSTAASAGKMPLPSQPLTMPAASKYKEEAGKFLEFYYSAEMQNEMYKATKVFPGSIELDPNLIETSIDKVLYDYAQNNAAMCYVWQHPGALEEAGYALTQAFLAGDITADEAAAQYEEAAAKWRNDNPDALENFKIWATEDMPFME
jgi:ABC-type glycerol-3-phosphate transport system substrate-binding protein